MNADKKTFPLFIILLIIFANFRSANAQDAGSTATPPPTSIITPAELIEAVNTLRLNSGLPALSAHSVLMQVAQTEANGIANGAPGHWRPNGMTLGQWLLSLDYPLSGDLSLDGYRSENWFFISTTTTKEDIITAWQGDAEHRETMFSVNRSDIGAGIAVTADGGLVAVLETALQTASGKMQYDAQIVLTGIPATQQAYSAMGTEAAENGTLPQYMLPVSVNTALPNGDVIHQVQYGQTLWSIAITYHTTIKEIQSLNNLYDTTISVGQKLIVVKGATQPAPSASVTATDVSITPLPSASSALASFISPTPTSPPVVEFREEDRRKNRFAIIAILATALFLGARFAVMTRKKDG